MNDSSLIVRSIAMSPLPLWRGSLVASANISAVVNLNLDLANCPYPSSIAVNPSTLQIDINIFITLYKMLLRNSTINDMNDFTLQRDDHRPQPSKPGLLDTLELGERAKSYPNSNKYAAIITATFVVHGLFHGCSKL